MIASSKRVHFNTTTGANLPLCNQEIYRRGQNVVASMFGKDTTEVIIKEMAKIGVVVDWHFIRNRIIIRTLDDVVKARRAWWDIVKKHQLDYHWKLPRSKPAELAEVSE